MQIRNNQSNQEVYKSVDIASLKFRAYVEDSNAAPAHGLDLTKMVLDIRLKRGGKTFSINGKRMDAVAQAKNFMNANYPAAAGVTPNHSLSAALKVFTFSYDFGQTINLRGDDELIVECRLNQGFFKAATLVEAGSLLEIQKEEGIGLEWGSPYTHTEVVPTSESKFFQALPPNVSKVYLIDTKHPVAVNLAEFGVQSVQIKSDKLNDSYDQIDLLALKRKHFLTASDADSRGNSIVIFDDANGVDLDDAKLEISFDSAQVTSQRYVLVYEYTYADSRLIQLAQARQAKHLWSNASKLR